MKKRILLTDSVFPASLDAADAPELYFHQSANARVDLPGEGIALSTRETQERCESAFLDFDAYFNAFPGSKWKMYSCVEALGARIVLRGEGSVSVHAYDARGQVIALCHAEFCSEDEEEIVFSLPDWNYPLLFIHLETATACGARSFSFYAEIEEGKAHEVFLSIAICTFRREEYVEKLLCAIERELLRWPELEKHIQVRVVDNGGTLDPNIAAKPWIRLYPNRNLGGSAGFARGMLETLEDASFPATHLLLMDDDVELPQGVLQKTIALLRCVNAQYGQALLGGAMLNLERKSELSASVEIIGGSRLHRQVFPRGLDLGSGAELLQHELPRQHARQYQGWWYCAIPVALLREKGLPFPFFIQVDDLEYSYRLGQRIMQVNGIGVWHEPFYKKAKNSRAYYWARNYLIFGALYPERWYVSCWASVRLILSSLLIFNYEKGAAARAGIEAFLKMPPAMGAVEFCAAAMDEAAQYDLLLVDAGALAKEGEVPASPLPLWKKLVMVVTLNGHLTPGLLQDREAYVPPPYRDSLHKLFLRRVVYLGTDKSGWGYRCERSRKRFFLELAKSAFCLIRLFWGRERFCRHYARLHAASTTVAAWKISLGLEDKK